MSLLEEVVSLLLRESACESCAEWLFAVALCCRGSHSLLFLRLLGISALGQGYLKLSEKEQPLRLLMENVFYP